MKRKDEYIIGVSGLGRYTHDSSAVILKNGRIVFASSEERYTRKKHDGSFPEKTIKAGLKYSNIKQEQISKIAVGYPRRNIISLLNHRHGYEALPFLVNILINRNVNLLSDGILTAKLLLSKAKEKQDLKILKNKEIVYIDHHLAHAASSYFTSGNKKEISISLDGFGAKLSGDLRTGAAYLSDKGELKEVISAPIYASYGCFFHAVTYMLGFKPGDGEGKTMGLAVYGKPNKTYKVLRRFCPKFKDGKWSAGEDWLAGFLTSVPTHLHMFKDTVFGRELSRLLEKHKPEDVAAGAQKLLEEEVVKLVSYLIYKYPEHKDISLSGGIFLNVKANKKIMEIKGVSSVFIHPNAGDGGTALGAAFMAYDLEIHKKLVGKKHETSNFGESYTQSQLLKVLKKYDRKITFVKHKDIAAYTSKQLLNQKVIGWFQGRSEWGPRALCFRSVLADPRKLDTKERINDVLKKRDWFMPFAPSILESEGKKYFKNFRHSPFMTMIFDIVKGKEKVFPAALHIDNTARPNSVNSSNNPLYFKVLKRFYKKTGVPIILNTSFNRHGLPIVNSPEDAIDHLIMGAIDELIIGNYSATLS